MKKFKVQTLDVQNVFANQMTSMYSAQTSHAAIAPTVEATEDTATEDPTTEVLAVEPTEVPASEATQKPKKAKKQQAITENQFNAQTVSSLLQISSVQRAQPTTTVSPLKKTRCTTYRR